ncbi:MAG: glutathione S-transferase [Aestuariivita sp.]|nr:glutathione S-transferase [Aestuariivita sp.]
MLRLYHFSLSPFSRKVRLSLAEKRIEVELVEERYWEKSTDLLRRNPAGMIPILRLDGKNYTESTAICEYLEDLYPAPELMPKDAAEKYEVRRIVNWFDDKFYNEVTKKLLNERVIKKISGEGFPDSKKVKQGAKRIKYHLDYMAWILERRRWLSGDVMTLADFAAAAQLSCLDYISDVDWNRSATVKDWYAKIKSRPAFRNILADQISGFPPPRHYNDLDF